MPRGSKGSSIKETWDVMGMRATRSDDTILDGVFIPDKYVARVVPAGVERVPRRRPRSRPLGRLRHVQEERARAALRDCRAGRFHPTNSALTHDIVGKITLGISPDEQPRWG